MQFVKEERTVREYVVKIQVGDKIFSAPLSSIKEALWFLSLCVIMAFAINFGSWSVSSQAEYYHYAVKEGCNPVAQGSALVWICPKGEGLQTLKFNTTYP